MTYFNRPNQQKGKQTELLDLRELEFNLLGITARNGTGISMVEDVTGYLPVGIKRTTDDLRETTARWCGIQEVDVMT